MCFQPLTITWSRPFIDTTAGVLHVGTSSRGGAPQLRAGAHVERRHERALLHVGLDDDAAVVDDRRARKSPLRVRHHVEAGIEPAEILLPQHVAGQRVGIQAFRSEHRDDVTAIGGERRARVRRLRMTLDDRHAGRGDPLPARLAGSLVEARHDPLVLGLVEHRADVAVETDLQLRIGRAADRARRADLIAPDDRARVAEARDRHPPFHQLRIRHAPLQRQRLRIIHAASGNAAEARPVDAGARTRSAIARMRCTAAQQKRLSRRTA